MKLESWALTCERGVYSIDTGQGENFDENT